MSAQIFISDCSLFQCPKLSLPLTSIFVHIWVALALWIQLPKAGFFLFVFYIKAVGLLLIKRAFRALSVPAWQLNSVSVTSYTMQMAILKDTQ